MEVFLPSLQSAPQSTMRDMEMDAQIQMLQQTILPLPHHHQAAEDDDENDENREERRKAKGENDNEIDKRDDDDEDDELLFNIDEFLVEEALIDTNNGSKSNSNSNSNSGDKNEGTMIIAESPTNANTNLNPSIMGIKESNGNNDTPIPANTNTNTNTNATTIINNTNNTNTNTNTNTNNTNTTVHKKKRKRQSRSRAKPKNADNCTTPKRPLSAYNLYFREERKRCLAETTTSDDTTTTTSLNSQEAVTTTKLSKKKKYNFEELGKRIGKGWRALHFRDKRELEVRAEADRERYRNEMIAYRREKRRKDREEDEDTLILMRHHHRSSSNGSHSNNTCPKSPTLSMPSRTGETPGVAQHYLPGGYFPSRLGDPYPVARHITDSPSQRVYQHGQQQQERYPQDKRHPYPDADATRKNHVRLVSISSPPYSGDMDCRSRNNISPAAPSYESCSSWSGDECEDDDDRDRKYENKNDDDEDGSSKGRDAARSEARSDNSTLSTKAVDYPSTPSNTPPCHPHIPCQKNGVPQSPVASSHGVAVARVVAMPATDGLRRILQDGRPSEFQSPPLPLGMHEYQQPPHAWMPWAHAHSQHMYHYHQPYSPPPPLQGAFAPPPSPHPTPQPQPQLRMLPPGMEIFLRNPTTGRQRSYRVQYTPQSMTAEQASQFQRLHAGIGLHEGATPNSAEVPKDWATTTAGQYQRQN